MPHRQRPRHHVGAEVELVRVLRGGDDPHALGDLVGRRVGARVGAAGPTAEHHDLVPGRRQRRGQMVHVPAEPADHHRRVLPRHHQDLHRVARSGRACRRMPAIRGVSCADTHARGGRGRGGHRGQPPGVERAEQAVGAVPAVGQALCVLAAARRQRAGDLAGGVRVQVRAVARVVGGGILADHERPVAGHRQQRLAQDLVGDEVARPAACRSVSLERLVHRASARCRRPRCSAGPGRRPSRPTTPASPCRNPKSWAAIRRVRRRSRRRPHRTACRPARRPRAARAAPAPATPAPRTTSARTVRCRTPRSRARACRSARTLATSRRRTTSTKSATCPSTARSARSGS